MAKWNVLRFAFYGAMVGCIFQAFRSIGLVIHGQEAEWLEGLALGAAGGGVLAAILTGLRNAFLR